MNKIFYHHIPKTGGQTLAMRIASAYPIGRSSIMGADLMYPDGINQLKHLLNTNHFVERHVNGPVLAYFPDVDILVTARDPVNQIVSNYLHVLREPASPLYRPAKLLAPQEFFARFGDMLANHQTRYFISAFIDLHPNIERLNRWTRFLLDYLHKARWLVPTEAIDEFCVLWQMEMGLQMMLPNKRVNIAEINSSHRKELYDIVSRMPELYSVDLLFWQLTKQFYAQYKRNVTRSLINNPYPDNWGRAWYDNGNGIWLGYGWHQPEILADGNHAWWAGPDRCSEIYIKRDTKYRFLVFSIVVYCGVFENNIILVTPDGVVLDTLYQRINDSEVVYVVDLNTLGPEVVITLNVPQVWSPVMVSSETNDTARKSLAVCKWALSSTPPLQGGENCIGSKNVNNLHAGDGHGSIGLPN